MSSRNIIVVLNKMISFVPDEENDFKYRLTKIMEGHPYKANEIQILGPLTTIIFVFLNFISNDESSSST